MELRPDRDGNTKVFLKDSFGKNNPEQICVIANSGYGKSLAVSSMAESYYDDGWVVIYLGDGGKGEEEILFSNFLPKEKYHLDFLNKVGKPIRTIPCKAYHSFSFNLPKTKISPYVIYTTSLKSCGRREISMLSETQGDSDTVRILMEAISNISKNAGLYQLLHEVQGLIKPEKSNKGVVKPSEKNFYLKVASASSKSMSDISSLFKPFLVDYFLAEESCKYNLDWKEILNDNKNIHFFSTRFIKDPKMASFVILSALNQIVMHKELSKKPILIVLPEARRMLGNDTSIGYKRFLAEACKECLSTMRSMGKGMASIMDSQNFSDLDTGVRDSFTKIFLGRLSVSDIDKLSKIFLFDKQKKDQLANPISPNTFLLLSHPEHDFFNLFLPGFRHAEVSYSIDSTFSQEAPEQMRSYSDMINEMAQKLSVEEQYFKEKAQKEAEEERLREKKKIEAKQNKDSPDLPKEEIKKIKEKEIWDKVESAYRMRVTENMTLERVGSLLGIGKDSVVRYVKMYEAKNKGLS